MTHSHFIDEMIYSDDTTFDSLFNRLVTCFKKDMRRVSKFEELVKKFEQEDRANKFAVMECHIAETTRLITEDLKVLRFSNKDSLFQTSAGINSTRWLDRTIHFPLGLREPLRFQEEFISSKPKDFTKAAKRIIPEFGKKNAMPSTLISRLVSIRVKR